MERKRSSGQSNGTASVDHPSSDVFCQNGDAVTRSIDLGTQDSETPEVKVVPDFSGSRIGEGPAASEPDHPPFSFRALTLEKKLTLLAMAFANFAACACFSLLAPFFPEEANKKGASGTMTGLIFSTFELWIFVSSPVYGFFLTRIGSRFLFLSGLFTCGTSAILFGLLDRGPPGTVFVVLCFVVRTVESLGASAFITASFAIIANTFPNHVSTVFAALETFTGLGLMVGPPIGGTLYELGGYGLPFWVMGGLLILCAVLISQLLPSSTDEQRRERGSVLSLLTNPLVLVTCITIIVASFSLGFLDPTLAEHLQPYNLSSAVVGLIFIVAPAVYALLAPLWGYLSDRKGLSFPLVVIGNLVAFVCFLMVGPSTLLTFLPHQLWLVVVGLALGGLGIGAALVCSIKCLVVGAKQVGFEDNLETFGLISGLFNSSFSLGMFIGPTVGSILVDHYGFDWAATVTAFIFVASAALFLLHIVLAKSCAQCCRCCHQCSKRDGDSSSPTEPLLRKEASDCAAIYGSISNSTTVVVSPPHSSVSDNS